MITPRKLAYKVYYRSPLPLRSLAASAYGWRLRLNRYGNETERLVDEALQRDNWSSEQWTAWQEKQLGPLLHRAATQVPYYRNQWLERRRRGDQASWEYLENWPILKKEAVRANPRAFVADDCDVRRMVRVQTSGTTGKSLALWRSRKTDRAWYALFEARCRRWYGVSRRDRWGILGGKMIVHQSTRQPPFWVWNSGLRQLYMSSYHLAPDLLKHYLEALASYEIDYLYGYTSALHELAQGVLKLGWRDLRMKVAITNAEPLFDYQRRAIQEAFRCEVRQTYGMAEIVTAASECPVGKLHLWPDVAQIEILSSASAAANGELAGALISTGLLNPDMPLIRYRVGDGLTLPRSSSACACGRSLPQLASVDGRLDDLLFTADGRRIGRLDPVFKSGLPVREAQIVQESLDLIRVRYVPASDYSEHDSRLIIEQLQARMGDVRVIMEPVMKVPRGPNGKFRAVICNLPREQKDELQRHEADLQKLACTGNA